MLPYETLQSVTVTQADTVVTLEVPSRTFLAKLIIVQDGGTDTFTADLFNRDPASADWDADLQDLYRICAQQNVTSGKLVQFFNPRPIVFNNDDANATARNTRKLYLRLNTVSSGDFKILVGTYSDVM